MKATTGEKTREMSKKMSTMKGMNSLTNPTTEWEEEEVEDTEAEAEVVALEEPLLEQWGVPIEEEGEVGKEVVGVT